MIKLIMLALGFLWPYLVNLVLNLLATLGVGFLTYAGVMTLFNTLASSLESKINTVPAALLNIAGASGIGLVIGGAMAGLATRFALNGVSTIKKLVFRKAA